MNAKSLTIGGALTALAVGIIYQYGELITPDFLLLAALVLFLIIVSYGLSWSATEAYKRLYHHQVNWKKEHVKRSIYRCALYSGAGSMLLCGSIFLLADFDTQQRIVFGVFWTIASLFVGFSSPLVWRWTFDKLLPRFNRFVSGKKDDSGENEAMDRPSEKPE